jgi:hypothetical protein
MSVDSIVHYRRMFVLIYIYSKDQLLSYLNEMIIMNSTMVNLFSLLKLNKFKIEIKGRHTSNDIAGFVRDNAYSPLRALTPTDFPSVTTDSKPFIIDFFSPVIHLLNNLMNFAFSFVHLVCIYYLNFVKLQNV